MQTAIKRKSSAGQTAELQDTAIKSVLNLPQTSTCNNSKCSCMDSCKVCKCKMPCLNPLSVRALARYRDELTSMEITREVSGLVDCCNEIIMANQGGRL